MKKILFSVLLLCAVTFATICHAESWQSVSTTPTQTIFIDADSVAILSAPDVTAPPSSNALMFSGKITFSDKHPQYVKNNIRTAIMQFNAYQNSNGYSEYRLTQTKYLSNSGQVIKTFGKTHFNMIRKGSMGDVLYNAAKKIATSNNL